MDHMLLLNAAYEQAIKGMNSGGLPIGSALAAADGAILSLGHNLRWQTRDVTAHAETVCLRNAGIRDDWGDLTLISTLSPCIMCTGTAVLFGIKRIIVGENITFHQDFAKRLLDDHGVQVTYVQDRRCIDMMKSFIEKHPQMWWGDIGLPKRQWKEAQRQWSRNVRRKLKVMRRRP
jgi:cytosine deaminase